MKEEKIYRQEAVVPDRGLPFKLFRFEGADGKYICEAHQHSCVEIFALREGKVDFYLGDKKYYFIMIISKILRRGYADEDTIEET